MSAVHVSNESSRLSSGVQHNILYYTTQYNRNNRALSINTLQYDARHTQRQITERRFLLLNRGALRLLLCLYCQTVHVESLRITECIFIAIVLRNHIYVYIKQQKLMFLPMDT